MTGSKRVMLNFYIILPSFNLKDGRMRRREGGGGDRDNDRERACDVKGWEDEIGCALKTFFRC